MSGAPDFSVIVPTFERARALERCLEALTKLDAAGPSFEVVVVDDGGTADLEASVEPARRTIRLRLLRQAHAGPAAARNAGLAAASGRWAAFTDDDCLPDSQWLVELRRAFESHPHDGLGGRTVSASPTVFCSATQLLVDYVTRPRAMSSSPRFLASNNIAFPAEPLRALGGFDARFPFAAGEDRDLCERWQAAGHGLQEVAGAVIRHDHPLGLRRFCRMHYRYGRGARQLHQQRTSRGDARTQLESPRFYAGLVLSPFARATRRRAALCGALLLSQVCHAAGYAREICSAGRAASTTSRCQSSSVSRFQR